MMMKTAMIRSVLLAAMLALVAAQPAQARLCMHKDDSGSGYWYSEQDHCEHLEEMDRQEKKAEKKAAKEEKRRRKEERAAERQRLRDEKREKGEEAAEELRRRRRVQLP